MKHIERIRPGFVVFVYVSCRIVVCKIDVYFPLYETELYKSHYKSTNYTYKWDVNCFMKKDTDSFSSHCMCASMRRCYELVVLNCSCLLIIRSVLYNTCYRDLRKIKRICGVVTAARGYSHITMVMGEMDARDGQDRQVTKN